MARATVFSSLLLLVLFAVAAGNAAAARVLLAPSFNSDDARKLGSPSLNLCSPLCTEVGVRSPQFKSPQLQSFCNQQCNTCVKDVSATKQGTKAPLPQSCQLAFQFPQVMTVVQDYLGGKISQERAVATKPKL